MPTAGWQPAATARQGAAATAGRLQSLHVARNRNGGPGHLQRFVSPSPRRIHHADSHRVAVPPGEQSSPHGSGLSVSARRKLSHAVADATPAFTADTTAINAFR